MTQASVDLPESHRNALSGEIARICPASFLQEALWALCQIQRDLPVYNESNVFRLSGPLDLQALARALNEIARRHEALRTTFRRIDGKPVQVIRKELKLSPEVSDLSSLPSAEREAEARKRAAGEVRAPFDLEHGPLIRVALLRLDTQHHWLLVTMHHIIRDGKSSAIFARELSALYRAYRAGLDSPLPELRTQYGDFTLQERQRLQGAALEERLAYWRRTLANLPALELPTDRTRPNVASRRGEIFAFALGEELTARLNDLRRREGTTLFTLLLAAFQVLLYRYSGQKDLAVGVSIANRTRDVEPLIGYFVNMLVVRSDLSGEPSFKEYLSRVRASTQEAYAHHDLPFAKLVEHLAPQRDAARSPLFQVSFVKGTQPDEAPELDALAVEEVAIGGTGAVKFDLDFTVALYGARIEVTVEYATDLFDRSTIERMAGHWQVLLQAIVADPQQRVSQLPLLSEAERQQLTEWNATSATSSREKCVHELFEAQALRTPEAVAAVCGNERLSYAELNGRANRLAHRLRTLGVGPEVLVAIAMERSLELVVGLLGILKAGGAYVPLDPGYPPERLAFMLSDAQAPVLLTQQRLLGKLPAYAGRTLCLDQEQERIAVQPESNPVRRTKAENLAYVIYTSGSTGQPKGVMVEHRSVANYLAWICEAFPLAASDRVLHKTPISFDASVEELFFPLVCGARLVVAGSEAHRSVAKLIETVRAMQISVLQVVPSLLAAMLDEPAFRACGSLRLLLCGAEVLSPELVRGLRRQSRAELINLYGPTETTISSTFWRCEATNAGFRVPIGKPIANTKTFVVDRGGGAVPIGVAGELWIAGAGVARGYLNRPEQTAESFVEHGLGLDPEGRLYKTGDVVRRLADGALEFLGRRDEQVKVRGLRVELAEVEAALKQQVPVRDAVVAADDRGGATRLVAFVVPREGAGVDGGELRAVLLRKLPDYMVPATFVAIESLPLTGNGKVDRAKLTALAPEPKTTSAGRVDPRNAVEVQVMRIWEQILDMAPIGVTENFFALGGDSLGAVRVIDRIEQLFGRRLPPDMLWYREGTIESLARALIDDDGLPLWTAAVPIKASGRRRPLFCPHIVGGHLYFYDNLARHLHEDQPLYGLPARGIDGKEHADATVESMAAHCIDNMKQVQPRGPYLLAGYCSGAVVAFEMARQIQARGESIELLALCDSLAPGFHPLEFGLMVRDLLRLRNLRLVQQRLYRFVLQNLGLGRLRRFRSVSEAHYWGLLSYRPKPYPGRAVLFRASNMDDSRSPSLGWKRFIAGELGLCMIDAGHGAMVREPTVGILAEKLEQHLARAGRGAWSREGARAVLEARPAVGL